MKDVAINTAKSQEQYSQRFKQ